MNKSFDLFFIKKTSEKSMIVDTFENSRELTIETFDRCDRFDRGGQSGQDPRNRSP